MQILQIRIDRDCSESEIYNELLDLDGRHILELGCGAAEFTRAIAEDGLNRRDTATEVDYRQHEKNLLIDDLPNVTFILAGAESIPQADDSFDIVMMFKSLHHVPKDSLPDALLEINRVLKPGGLAYISEPVYMGDLNDIMRLFHDERLVREAAFSALQSAVDSKLFKLVNEVFFNSPVYFEDFADFEKKVLNVTHTDHRLSDETFNQVRDLFLQHMRPDGVHFQAPMRVDLLQKA